MTYDLVSDAAVKTVAVQSGGSLVFRTDVNTRLTVVNLLVKEGGLLQIGTGPIERLVTRIERALEVAFLRDLQVHVRAVQIAIVRNRRLLRFRRDGDFAVDGVGRGDKIELRDLHGAEHVECTRQAVLIGDGLGKRHRLLRIGECLSEAAL